MEVTSDISIASLLHLESIFNSDIEKIKSEILVDEQKLETVRVLNESKLTR